MIDTVYCEKINTNNRRILSIQQKGMPCTTCSNKDPDLTYMGHASLQVTSPSGIKILIDPWGNDPDGFWGLWFHKLYPMTHTDILLSTHNHFDHNAFDRVKSPMLLDRMSGHFKIGDVEVEGIADKHAIGKFENDLFDELELAKHPPNNDALLDHTMFLVKVGDFCLLFWGDNRPNPPEYVWEKLCQNTIDIVMLPMDDSHHLMDYEDIDKILNKLHPRAVVPVHYKTENITSVLSTLQPINTWIKSRDKNSVIKVGNHTQALNNKVKSWPTSKFPKTLYFESHVPYDVSTLEIADAKQFVCGKSMRVCPRAASN